jgi:hypothetical protein
MGTEQRVNTNFINYRGQIIPSIPGLQHWAFYGSGGSGNNGNQAPGGPASSVVGTTPMQVNYLTSGTAGTLPTFSSPITLTGGGVNAPTVLTPGSNYNYRGRIAYSGGGGSGAQDITTVGGGQVTGLNATLHLNGTGYTTAPTPTSPAGNNSLIDTGVTRASLFAAGWTIGIVCRMPAAGAPSSPFGDGYDYSNTGFNMLFQMQASTNLCRLAMFTASDCTLTLPSAQTQWRFLVATFGGGATGAENLFSMSDALQATPYTAGASAAATGQQICFGATPLSGNVNTSDIAFSMVAGGPLPYAACVPIYQSVKTILANRGIVVL